METALGLLGLVAFIVAVIAFAAAVTYLVIMLTPAEKEPKAETPAS
jgi:hypothetical protein